jgi:hypothetical protein
MNMYMLTIYIIYGPFGDVMLSHDLQLDFEGETSFVGQF